MDELAEKLVLDPIDLAFAMSPRMLRTDFPYSSRHSHGLLQEGARRFGWTSGISKPGEVRDGRWLRNGGRAANAGSRFTVEGMCDWTGRFAIVRMAMTDSGTGSLYHPHPDRPAKCSASTGASAGQLVTQASHVGSGGSLRRRHSGSSLFRPALRWRLQLPRIAGMDPNTAALPTAASCTVCHTKSLTSLSEPDVN